MSRDSSAGLSSFDPLLSECSPCTGAFDCTFTAPKSVTLLFALGSTEVRREVGTAHDAAVDAALAVYEAEAARVRRGRGGKQVLQADGFVAAAFRHRTSRAGDPHLHTHVVVANMAHAPSDDRWTTLDGRQLYACCRTTGFLYEAHLRHPPSQGHQRPLHGSARLVGEASREARTRRASPGIGLRCHRPAPRPEAPVWVGHNLGTNGHKWAQIRHKHHGTGRHATVRVGIIWHRR